VLDIVFFSSPIGLGHASRDIAISQHLGDISKRFVSGSAAAKLISTHGFETDDLYKPPAFHVKNGKLQDPLRWLVKYYSYYKECKKISSQVMEKSQPHMIISDEDFASLVVAKERGIKTVLVTDVLETKFAKGIGSLVEKKMNQSLRDIIQKCNLVIIPENGENESNIVRVGPIIRKTTYSRQQLREIFSFTKKTVIVSAGGTDAGEFLIEKALQVFEQMNLDAELVVVSGPILNVSTSKVRNLGFVNNLHEIIFAADLVISLAGRSTIDESTHYGTPGIFIPIKGHFEQEENAKQIGYSYDDIFRLDGLISEKINERRKPLPCNGAEKAVDLIRSLL